MDERQQGHDVGAATADIDKLLFVAKAAKRLVENAGGPVIMSFPAPYLQVSMDDVEMLRTALAELRLSPKE